MDAPGRADLESIEARRTALPIGRLGSGYGAREVDEFVSRLSDAVRGLVEENDALRAGVSPEGLRSRSQVPRMTPFDVQDARFPLVRFGRAYKMRPVDEFLDDVTETLTRLLAENEVLRGSVRPPGP